MDVINDIRKRASQLNKTIVLPESDDERVLRAAHYLVKHEICKVMLIGEGDKIREQADEIEVQMKDIVIIDPQKNENTSELAGLLYNKRKHKGLTKEEAQRYILNPLYFAAALTATRKADGAVAGSVATTGDVLRAALHSIGLRTGSDVVSSIFLMAMPDGKVFTYGDCGVVPYPTASQLATIAQDSASTHHRLTEQEPSVAMLSFSTKGSALHERVELVTDALEMVKKNDPALAIDGELQFDAAFVPEVGRRKAPESAVAGRANVYIFPNLDAGNIAYKITERLAGAIATGPVIQGLARPMMDLSRGCNWEDIVNAAAVCVLMGE